VVEEAVALRAAVFGVFAATAAGATPAQPDLAAVRDGYAAAVRAARLVPAGNGLGWSWRGPAMEPLARPLWPVAASAAELATSPDRLRRVSAAPATAATCCSWTAPGTGRGAGA
jgi:predicted RNA-binding Zn ribbon-like protein